MKRRPICFFFDDVLDGDSVLFVSSLPLKRYSFSMAAAVCLIDLGCYQATQIISHLVVEPGSFPCRLVYDSPRPNHKVG